MNVDVALLPRDLPPLVGTSVTVIVFDVLRATTTIAAALTAGVREIHVFPDTASARHAATAARGAAQSDVPNAAEGGAQRAAGDDAHGLALLCGEEQCLPPAGFDLGNSPGSFTAALHAGRRVFMSTTNGTRAILAARGAGRILTGALVNAGAVARVARDAGADVILLCAGTNGHAATEDVLGAGAVLHALRSTGAVHPASDTAWMAEQLFLAHRADLPAALRASRGGRNVTAAGLAPDVDFAARLDALPTVGHVRGDAPPVISASEA